MGRLHYQAFECDSWVQHSLEVDFFMVWNNEGYAYAKPSWEPAKSPSDSNRFLVLEGVHGMNADSTVKRSLGCLLTGGVGDAFFLFRMNRTMALLQCEILSDRG